MSTIDFMLKPNKKSTKYSWKVSVLRFLCVSSILLSVTVVSGCQRVGQASVPSVTDEKTPCAHLVVAGFPQYGIEQTQNRFVCHQGYALAYNTQSKTPMWVVEHLTAEHLKTKNATRENDFRPDPDLPDRQEASLESYRRSGFDRGHMAPAEDFRGSVSQMSESFFLSNMVPQNPENNRGIWADLEKNVRGWAVQRGDLYVITGPIFYGGKPMGWIGRAPSQVAVPTYLYKIILDRHRRQIIAFVVPNQPAPVSQLSHYVVKLSDVERLTGLNFFPQLNPEQKQALSYQVPDGSWRLF